VHAFEKLGAYASSMTFTNDGSVFILGLRNGKIMLWNTTEYTKLAEIDSGEEEVTSLFYYNHLFSENQRKAYILFGASSGALKLLDVSTQKVVWKDISAVTPV
jgi:WD40 repeat protein